MRTKYLRSIIAFTLLAVLLTFLSSSVFAQDVGTNSVPVIGSPDNAAAVATPFIVSFVAKYTWLATVFMVIGVLRFFAKPLITLVEAYVKATPSTTDDAFLAKCEASVIYRWFWWGLDWLGSIKPFGASTTNPALTKQGN
ncbi:MAG: hypothetical protein ACTHKU_07815 [Verrucomicrobiota bacterium]